MNRLLASVVAGLSMTLPAVTSLAQVAGQVGTVAPVEAREYGKYYWKKWDPMTLDRSQVAVQAWENLNQLEAGLEVLASSMKAARAFTVDSWWLRLTVPANTTPEQLVGTPVAQPTIDFATPVFAEHPAGAGSEDLPHLPDAGRDGGIHPRNARRPARRGFPRIQGLRQRQGGPA